MVEGPAADLGLSDGEWPEPIRSDWSVDRSGEQVTARGEIHATARLDCVRCLKSFDLALEVPVVVHADRAGRGRHPEQEGDLERDDYMRFHDGRQVELGEDVREALLLEVPMAPSCRVDCRGLCPRCGAELNEGPCGCATESRA
ncbi:MAG: DUF177 domain-containing protein [Candidatus Eisenbacteria bacterium]|uniref:DUF177 domain-containing protein n=1 Tax=Eiseniibacteriota bacterium TaxID=2212470 RepID=A0A849SLK1_UNCEI|nr:DUF177 domain-containing protein [Candidatus Eisenbacteria bacterium]